MADVVYRDIREWQNAPIQKLVVTDAVSGDRLFFFYPTEDSTYEILAVTRRAGSGAERLVGWMLQLAFRCVMNNVETMLTVLEPLAAAELGATLILKADATAVHARTVSITLPSPIGISWKIMKGQAGPEFEVNITRALPSLLQVTGVDVWQDDTETITDPVS